MAVKLSTGLKDAMLITGPARTALTGAVIRVYSGSVPNSPNDALSGNTLLLEVSLNGVGTGISWESLTQDGALLKSATELWTGTVIANGVATFFRMVLPSDTGAASITAIRVQGSVGVLGADLAIPEVSLTTGAIQNINAGAFGLI